MFFISYFLVNFVFEVVPSCEKQMLLCNTFPFHLLFFVSYKFVLRNNTSLILCQVPVESLVSSNFTSSVFIFLAGIVTILGLYEYWFRSLRTSKLGNQIPGPPTIPILGNAHLALGRSPTGKGVQKINVCTNLINNGGTASFSSVD